MAPIIISFDGNIGSGKSSVVRYFEKNFAKYCNMKTYHYNICFLQEPVSIWESIKDENGKNAIEKFYENNERYSFAFQMMAYISRLSLFREALTKNYDIIITERSMYTDKNVFAKMLHDNKKMDNIEYQIYLKWFDEFTETIKDLKTIYIRTNPEICDMRVKKRNRLGEIIPLEYLKNCHHYHDIWLNNPEKLEEGSILIINGNEETNTSQFIENNFYDKIMEKVFNYIK
tara:strand:- start:134 stop:823 length:690 start_codon:yes stop_codon:yes gene_type:complete